MWIKENEDNFCNLAICHEIKVGQSESYVEKFAQ